jgi:hypothetical protein
MQTGAPRFGSVADYIQNSAWNEPSGSTMINTIMNIAMA